MRVLRHLTFPQLIVKELALRPLTDKLWDGTKPQDLISDASISWYETGAGLVLLQTVEHPSGRELFVRGIVGRDILTRGEEIMADLREIAAARGCRWIGGEAISPALARAYRKLLPEVGFRFLTEI